jgi:glycosyltransferase involved in cell wall biosynthesis
MKILYHHRIASKDGQYVHVEEIINAFKQLNHEVYIVAPNVAEKSDFGSDGGWVDALKAKLPKFIYEILEFSYSFYAFFKLAHAILKFKPDVIYERYNLFFPAGIWASKVFRIPLQLEVNAPLYQERKKYDGISLDGLALWTQKSCWRHAHKALPVTDVLANCLREIGVAEKNIEVIPNGINEKAFYAPTIKPDVLPDLSGKIVIGFVGFVRDWHGLDRVLDIMNEFNDPNLYFLIIGDGPAVSGLKLQAKRQGLNEQMFVSGIVQRHDMPNWVAQIEIALQPDVVAYASPLKMLEYLALGKAIVAPNTPNIRELLNDNQNALLFDENDEKSFSGCITRLLESEDLRKRLGRSAADTIKQKSLTWLNNGVRITTGFKELLKGTNNDSE